MLGIDVGGNATDLLRLGNDVEGERRLPGRLGTVDLGDPAARQSADPEREVEGDTPGRDGFDLQRVGIAHLHDRALAELALDLGDREVDGTDRKSTRLNSSHANISYAVFCLK